MYLPESEKVTEVIPHRILSLANMLIWRWARKSNSRQLESSEPVPNTLPSGKNCTELMSDSCPGKVEMHFGPTRWSKIFAVESQLPLTKRLEFSKMETDITSPVWSEKVSFGSLFSMSHRIHVESPELVIISELLMNRQHDKYPSCCAS